MKKILIITFLLLPFIGFSQTTKPIDGFLGIKFGSTKLAVIAAMKAKGATIDKANSTKDELAFNNVHLGHRLATQFTVFFIENKASEADYVFDTDVEAKIPGYYQDLVNDLNQIYGEGKSTANYTSPYQAGDGNELLGLSSGKIDFHTSWSDQKNYIEVDISTKMEVELSYQDGILSDKADAKQKAKEKSDY